AAPTIQKIGPAAGTQPAPLSAKGTSNAVLTIKRPEGSAPAPAQAPSVAAPPPPKISISNTVAPPPAMHKPAGAPAPAPAVQRLAASIPQLQEAPPLPKDVSQFSHVHHYLEYARNVGAS